MYKIKYIEKAVVAPIISEKNEIKRIIAFCKIKENCRKNETDIKNELKANIPSYMIPVIKIIEEIPLNKNDKCDTKKLLEDYCNGK